MVSLSQSYFWPREVLTPQPELVLFRVCWGLSVDSVVAASPGQGPARPCSKEVLGQEQWLCWCSHSHGSAPSGSLWLPSHDAQALPRRGYLEALAVLGFLGGCPPALQHQGRRL